MNGAVNLAVAHRLEAKVLLDWFDLTEIEPKKKFRCYGGSEGIALTVTGMGVANAAAGVRHLHDSQPPGFRAWLNIGIAGHDSAALGEGFLIRRIMHRESGELYWPPVTDLKLPDCELITVAEPETGYPEDAAYDMEGAGFFAAAAGLISSDLVYVFKIISDNRENPVANVDPKQVPDLIRGQESAIRKLVSHLRERSARFAGYYGMPVEFDLLLDKYRFSATRKAGLARLCRRFHALGKQDRLTALARERFRDAASLMTAMDAELARTGRPVI